MKGLLKNPISSKFHNAHKIDEKSQKCCRLSALNQTLIYPNTLSIFRITNFQTTEVLFGPSITKIFVLWVRLLPPIVVYV